MPPWSAEQCLHSLESRRYPIQARETQRLRGGVQEGDCRFAWDPFSRNTLAIIYYQEGRNDDAIRELKKALEIDPKNAQTQATLRVVQEAEPFSAPVERF